MRRKTKKKILQDKRPDGANRLKVGEMTIGALNDGSIWLSNGAGEMIQVQWPVMEKCLREFFHENF